MKKLTATSARVAKIRLSLIFFMRITLAIGAYRRAVFPAASVLLRE
jgi:hypothetical protein